MEPNNNLHALWRRSITVKYQLLDSGETLSFSSSALDHLSNYRQQRFWQPEAGGPLFIKSHGTEHIVEIACGPFERDQRRRFSFRPHQPSTQDCINKQWKLGRHYIGSWHTHPELKPTPSATDLQTMKQLFIESDHQLNAFIFAIVGNGELPASLYVAAWTDGQCYSLPQLNDIDKK